MASIRKSPNSSYWIACFTRADGTRTNVSTKSKDRTRAKQVAERLQEAEYLAREGRLVTDKARMVLNEILVRAQQEPLSTETVEAFFDEWLKGKSNSGTAERYKNTANLFLQSLGTRAKSPLTAVTHRDILAFIKRRRDAGAAPKTISVDAKTLNTAFNLARKLGHIQTNPVEKALALQPIQVESSEKDCFQPEQVATLVAQAEGDWKTAILLGHYTGARLRDCANLTWANVNFSEGVIDYVPQKTGKRGKRVVVPMHPELAAHLETLRGNENGRDICPSLAGRATGGKSGLSEAFKKLMHRAGVDDQLVAGKGKRKFSKLSFHSLRHSFNSSLANSGVDQETRMKLTGHSSVAINSGYTHIGLPKLKEAIYKIPSLVLRAEAGLQQNNLSAPNDTRSDRLPSDAEESAPESKAAA